jgi:hypothetical protein
VTDLLIDLDQLLHQGLKAAKLGNFLFGFVYGGRRRQGLRDGLACDLLRESSMRPMSGILRSSTMTIRFATASVDGGNGAGLKITDLGEFLQEVITAVEQFG